MFVFFSFRSSCRPSSGTVCELLSKEEKVSKSRKKQRNRKIYEFFDCLPRKRKYSLRQTVQKFINFSSSFLSFFSSSNFPFYFLQTVREQFLVIEAKGDSMKEAIFSIVKLVVMKVIFCM